MSKPSDILAKTAFGLLVVLVLVQAVSLLLLQSQAISGWEAVAVYMWGTVIGGFGFGLPLILGAVSLVLGTSKQSLAVSSVVLSIGMFVFVFVLLAQTP